MPAIITKGGVDGAKRMVDNAGDSATSSVLDGWTADERAWFLFEASQER